MGNEQRLFLVDLVSFSSSVLMDEPPFAQICTISLSGKYFPSVAPQNEKTTESHQDVILFRPVGFSPFNNQV